MADTVKDTLHNLAEQLPESATWDDMMRKIYEHQIIESGLADSMQIELPLFKMYAPNTGSFLNASLLD